MKKLLFVTTFIFSIIVLVSCTQTEQKTDLTKKNLMGKVKQITEKRYLVDDKFENIENDTLVETNVLLYDENGFRSKKDFRGSDDPDCKYDEKGNPIEYTYKGWSIHKWKLKWDDKGRVIEESVFDTDGNLKYKRTFKYDNNGNNIEREDQTAYTHDTNRFMYSKYVYKYDNKNNKIGWYREDNIDSSLSPMETYKYDDNGNILEEKSFSDGVLSAIIKYDYDNNGNLIEVKTNSLDRDYSSKATINYDEKGNEIERVETGVIDKEPIKIKNTYKYEFDKNGNWIKKIEYEDGIAEMITKREIEYY